MKRDCHFGEVYKIDEENIIYSEVLFNGLFKLNIINGQAKFICSFPDKEGIIVTHKFVRFVGEHIFFFPFYGEYLSVYYRKGIEAKIKMPEMSEVMYVSKAQGDYLMFSRKREGAVYRFNYREMDIKPEEALSRTIREQTNNGILFKTENTISEDSIFFYVLINSPNAVVRVHKTSYKVTDIYEFNAAISAIITFKGGLWLAEQQGSCVWRIDLLTKQRKSYKIPTSKDSDDISYKFIVNENRLILLPMKESRVWIYREDKECFDVLFNADTLCVGGVKQNYKLFSGAFTVGNALLFTPWLGYSIVKVDLKSEEATVINLHYEAEFEEQRKRTIKAEMQDKFRNMPVLNEDAYNCTLEKFIIGV